MTNTDQGGKMEYVKRQLVLSSSLLILMTCFLPILHGQQTQSAQQTAKAAPGYPIQVHISAIHIRTHCGKFTHCDDVLYADATLNGKKVDLMGDVVRITPGDYVARFEKQPPVPDIQKLGQKYEILFPDDTRWRCTVTGFSE